MDLKRDKWTDNDYKKFLSYLSSLTDEDYKKFNERLIPDTPHYFGIRIPAVRKIAKEISKGNLYEFLSLEKGDFHEEIIIDGLVRASKKCSYDELLKDILIFSEKIYNWAICDTVDFKNVKNYIPEFFTDKDLLLKSDNPWQIRYGLGILMKYYLNAEYINEVLCDVEKIKSDFYYVNMMQAWLLATAVAKERDKTVEFLKSASINDTVFKMTVGKVRDSYRVSAEDKILIKNIR